MPLTIFAKSYIVDVQQLALNTPLYSVKESTNKTRLFKSALKNSFRKIYMETSEIQSFFTIKGSITGDFL